VTEAEGYSFAMTEDGGVNWQVMEEEKSPGKPQCEMI
jgi:hypothetical protein